MSAGRARCEACSHNFESMVELAEHVDEAHRVPGKNFVLMNEFKTEKFLKTRGNAGKSIHPFTVAVRYAILLYSMSAGRARCEACSHNFESMVELAEHVDEAHRVPGKNFVLMNEFKTEKFLKTRGNAGKSIHPRKFADLEKTENLVRNLPICQEHIYFPKVISTQFSHNYHIRVYLFTCLLF